MKKKIIVTLYKKELLDILRDTKTIIIMLMVPLVLYPLVFFGSLIISSSIITESTVKTYNAAIVDEYTEAYEVTEKLLKDSLETKEYHFDISGISKGENFEELVRKDNYDIIIEPQTDGEFFDVILYSMSAKVKSTTAESMVNEIFKDYNKKIVEEKLHNAIENYDEISKDVFSVKSENFATKEENTGMIVGIIMPFFMIISVMMGAFTIAIDVSVGERERGTLETLLTLPISNLEMMVSKFMAVTTIALTSVLLNVLSFLFMGLFVGKSIEMVDSILGEFDFASFILPAIIMIPIVIVFTMFVSSLCLCVDFMAKSVKEANNLTTPILLIFMLGAGVSVLPSLKLDYKLALVPIVNVTLLIKDLFMLDFHTELIGIVFFSTLLYTVVSIFVMIKLFSSEDILFGEGLRSFKLFEKRANMKKGQIPGYGDILFMFAIVFILSNYMSAAFLSRLGIWGTAVGQGIMFVIPVIYAWYVRADLKKLFSIEKPRIVELIGAILFVAGLRLLLNPLLMAMVNVFPKLAAQNEQLSSFVLDASFPASLIVVGIIPAIAEETIFRGFFYGSLINKKNIPAWVVCVVTAVVFAAFHMNLFQFLYVTLMGLAMSYMIYNSKSIFVTALYHLLNNSMSVCFAFSPWFQKNLGFLNLSEFDAKSLTLSLVAGFSLLILGFFISDRKIGFFRIRKKENAKDK